MLPTSSARGTSRADRESGLETEGPRRWMCSSVLSSCGGKDEVPLPYTPIVAERV